MKKNLLKLIIRLGSILLGLAITAIYRHWKKPNISSGSPKHDPQPILPFLFRKKEKEQKISRLGRYKGYSKATYKGFSNQSLYLRMRDGVAIAIDVYLPKELEKDKKIPTIAYFLRYVRSFEPKGAIRLFNNVFFGSVKKEEIQYFTSHGYACVLVDGRGTGASFGHRTMEFSEAEIKDMAEVMDWIVRQSWSDGGIGTTGVSYTGTTAELALVNQHSALKACIPRCSIFDLYADICFPGGVRQGAFIKVWRDLTRGLDHNDIRILGLPAQTVVKGIRPVDEDAKGRLLQKALIAHDKNFDIISHLLEMEFRDAPHPELQQPIDDFSVHRHRKAIAASGVPIYRMTGWYDGALVNSAIKGFWNTENTTKLLIGPWDHGMYDYLQAHGATQQRSFDIFAEMLRFFDHHLKGIDNGIDKEKAIAYYEMGRNQWQSSDVWPIQTATHQHFFLSALNGLTTDKSAIKHSETTYWADETVTTGKTSRWNSLVLPYRNGATYYPERSAENTKMLVFTSAPLSKPQSITGHPLVSLYISADATDATIFVYLEDVAPSGKVAYITEGLFRAIHRKIVPKTDYRSTGFPHSFQKEDTQALIPEEITHLQFDLLPISYQFKKGHSIRLSIALADAGHFDLTTERPSRITVYFTKQHASYISLPIVSS